MSSVDTSGFVLPLPSWVLHPYTAVVIAAVHVYLSFDHLSELLGGPPQWTDIWKGFGSLGGGANQLLDSAVLTVVNSATSQVTMDLSPMWNGNPTMLNFYSGGIDGTLVYSETEAGPTINFNLPTQVLSDTWTWSQDGDLPGDTIDQKWKPPQSGSITTPGGTVLPGSDAIDLIDFGATSAAPVSSPIFVPMRRARLASSTWTENRSGSTLWFSPRSTTTT